MRGWNSTGLNGHELGQAPGDGEGEGGLACHSLWDHKHLDATWQLNTQTLFIPDKDFKLTVLKILKEGKKNTQRAEGIMKGTKANQNNI